MIDSVTKYFYIYHISRIDKVIIGLLLPHMGITKTVHVLAPFLHTGGKEHTHSTTSYQINDILFCETESSFTKDLLPQSLL